MTSECKQAFDKVNNLIKEKIDEYATVLKNTATSIRPAIKKYKNLKTFFEKNKHNFFMNFEKNILNERVKVVLIPKGTFIQNEIIKTKKLYGVVKGEIEFLFNDGEKFKVNDFSTINIEKHSEIAIKANKDSYLLVLEQI